MKILAFVFFIFVAALDGSYVMDNLLLSTYRFRQVYPAERKILPCFGLPSSKWDYQNNTIINEVDFDCLVEDSDNYNTFLDKYYELFSYNVDRKDLDDLRYILSPIAFILDNEKQYDRIYNPLATFVNKLIYDFNLKTPEYPKRSKYFKVPPAMSYNYTMFVFENTTDIVKRGLAISLPITSVPTAIKDTIAVAKEISVILKNNPDAARLSTYIKNEAKKLKTDIDNEKAKEAYILTNILISAYKQQKLQGNTDVVSTNDINILTEAVKTILGTALDKENNYLSTADAVQLVTTVINLGDLVPNKKQLKAKSYIAKVAVNAYIKLLTNDKFKVLDSDKQRILNEKRNSIVESSISDNGEFIFFNLAEQLDIYIGNINGQRGSDYVARMIASNRTPDSIRGAYIGSINGINRALTAAGVSESIFPSVQFDYATSQELTVIDSSSPEGELDLSIVEAAALLGIPIDGRTNAEIMDDISKKEVTSSLKRALRKIYTKARNVLNSSANNQVSDNDKKVMDSLGKLSERLAIQGGDGPSTELVKEVADRNLSLGNNKQLRTRKATIRSGK